MTDPEELHGEEIVLLIEALDALIPFSDENACYETWDVRQRWLPYHMLRGRLKQAVHMSFYDHAQGWLDNELRRERDALLEGLVIRFGALLRDPAATRRSIDHGFRAAVKELREKRQSRPRPLS